MTDEPRFFLVGESLSGHCCFSVTVCDRTKPRLIAGKHVGRYESVCECFFDENADLVVAALNAAEETKKHQDMELRAAERGAWFAFDAVLGWINTQSTQTIDKKTLYKEVMQMRPAALAGLTAKDKQ